ncbi:hypothetical protein [Bacillus sp. 03113]|nr:hypothetical protein [Bacillus sp. 03113]
MTQKVHFLLLEAWGYYSHGLGAVARQSKSRRLLQLDKSKSGTA